MHPVETYIETRPVIFGFIFGFMLLLAPLLFPPVRRLVARGWKLLASFFPGNKQVLDKISELAKAVQAVNGKVDLVKYQVQTNDGGSLKDSVLRIEKQQADLVIGQSALLKGQTRLESHRQNDFWTRPRPGLEMDSIGRVSLASEAACRLFKVSDPDQLLNHSWQRFLDGHHIAEFRSAFRETAESNSIFRFVISIRVDGGEDRGEWEFKAIPIDMEDPKRYSGFFAPVDPVAKEIAGRAGWSG